MVRLTELIDAALETSDQGAQLRAREVPQQFVLTGAERAALRDGMSVHISQNVAARSSSALPAKRIAAR